MLNPLFGVNSKLTLRIIFSLAFCSALNFANDLVADDQLPIELEVKASPIGVNELPDLSHQSSLKISSQEIKEAAATHFQDFVDSIPDLNWSGATSRPRFFQIRGIGELEQYEGAPNESVAFLVDDLDLTGLGSVGNLYDSESIYVLRGPQGFGFGKSALAGLISIRTNEPTPQTSGHIDLGAGNDDAFEGGAAVGGPLSREIKNIQYRIAINRNRSDGFRDNLFLGRDDTNKIDESTLRTKLRFLPSESVKWDINFSRFISDNGFDAFAIDNSLKTQSDRPGVDTQHTSGASSKLAVDFGNDITLSNTTSLVRAATVYSFDGDWGNNPFWHPFDPNDFFSSTARKRSTVSNELRLESIPGLERKPNWVIGTYFQRLHEDSDNNEFSDGEVFDSLQSKYLARTNAAFLSSEIPIAGRTAFLTGLRAENKTSSYSDSKAASFSPIETTWNGLFGISQELSRDNKARITLSKGSKGGGFNTGANVPRDRLTFSPEYLRDLESTLENTSLANRLKSSVTFFYMRRRDEQVKLALQDNPADPLSFTYVTDNAASGTNQGIEVNTDFALNDRISVFARGALLDAKFNTYDSDTRDLSGRRQSHAPPWQYSVGSHVSFPYGIFLRGEVTGKDSFYFDDSHDQQSKPYHLTNLSVGVDHKDWSLTLWSRNLFNQLYAVRGFFFGNEPPDFPNKLYIQRGNPREFGLTLSFYF